MKPATVVIKKYGNRRLYDTAGSCYVNLDDTARFAISLQACCSLIRYSTST